MQIEELKDKNILILGFARGEGRSVLGFIRKFYPTKKITGWDQASPDKLPAGYEEEYKKDKNLQYKLSVGDWKKLKGWEKFDLIIKSAGIPLKNLPKEVLTNISSETQIFFDLCPGKIIGITGTKGKSTTSSLIYDVIKSSGTKTVLLGNIGKPALDHLDEIDKNTLVVFELSSHQLQTLNKSPHIAIILNVFPEHLDYYTSYSDYVFAKVNIAKFQTERDFLIINEDFPELKKVAKNSKAQIFPIGKSYEGKVKEVYKKSKLIGDFNQLNILAAKRVAEILGISDKIFAKAVQNFQPLEHRLEFIGEFKHVKFYNDSIATIPEATIGALDALGNDVETIFLGGFDRGIEYKSLAQRIKKSKLKNLILFPTTGEKIWEAIEKEDPEAEKKYQHFDVDNMKDAVKLAYEHTSPKKVALLSCASTSFNLFKDYADRGQQFKDWVVKLAKMS